MEEEQQHQPPKQAQQKNVTINVEAAPRKPPRLKVSSQEVMKKEEEEENISLHLVVAAANAGATEKQQKQPQEKGDETKKQIKFHSPLRSAVERRAASSAELITPTTTTTATAKTSATLCFGGNRKDGVRDAALAKQKQNKKKKENKLRTIATATTLTLADKTSGSGNRSVTNKPASAMNNSRGDFPKGSTPTATIKGASSLTGHCKTTVAITTAKTATATAMAAAQTAAAAGNTVSGRVKVSDGEGIDVEGANDGCGGAVKSRLVRGCSSLMYACQHGDIVEVLAQLRSRPERIRQRDSSNKNALHYCAAQKAETRDLVAAASIAVAAPELLESADEDGFTPLHLAVIQGNLAMVNLLLANKADVNAVDKEGHSVVHWATVCGEVEALRSVLAAGANIALADLNGGTPLHYAAQMCGASVDSRLGQTNATKLALEILGILLAHPHSSVDVQDKDGRQPLLWAASAGSAKAVIALVKAGARVESADKDGLTALHCAASRGHTECIDTLIGLCGAPTDLIDCNGCTSLHYAVTLGHADATARLLDLDADPNRQDRKGRTPAHCGCSKGQIETVKLLKQRGANLWLRNAKGDLPVHEAVASGRRELVEWLLEQRTKQVNTTSNDGRSLLHIAAINDYTDVCKSLLDFGGDINAIYRNSKGVLLTPLDCALQRGYRSTAKFLQSHGGLPASKLRLAARRSNPFEDFKNEMVRPLRYVEKEELHDLRNSKKYVVYLKHSDSEGGGGAAGEADSNCSCNERIYRREQKYAHTCRRHQRSSRRCLARRRTSSCGEPKELLHREHDAGEMDICRSKSNIELRRLRSRERYASSSEWEERDDGRCNYDDEEDSCENCCYHKRQKQRVIRRRSISRRRSKSRDRGDEHDRNGDDRDGDERDASMPKSNEREVELELQKNGEKNKEENAKVPTPSSNKPQSGKSEDARSVSSRPQSATTKRAKTTATGTPGKEGTFIIKSTREDDEVVVGQSSELTDEEGKLAAELVTTQVDVHRVEEDVTSTQQAEVEEKAGIEQMEKQDKEEFEQLVDEMSKEVDQVMKIAATAVENDTENGGNGEAKKEAEKEAGKDIEQLEDKRSEAEGEDYADAVPVEEEVIVKTLVSRPPEPIPSNVTKTTAIPAQSMAAAQETTSEDLAAAISNSPTPAATDTQTSTTAVPPTTASTNLPNANGATDAGQAESAATASTAAAVGSEAVTDETKAERNNTKGNKEQEAEIPNKPTEPKDRIDQPATPSNTPSNSQQTTTAQPAQQQIQQEKQQQQMQQQQQQREQESRRSFTLLPSDSAEDETVEEVVRKTSFQILKSDESAAEIVSSQLSAQHDEHEFSDSQVFRIISQTQKMHLHKPLPLDTEVSSADDRAEQIDGGGGEDHRFSKSASASALRNRHGVGGGSLDRGTTASAVLGVYDSSSNGGRKRRLKKRVKSGPKTRSMWQKNDDDSPYAGEKTSGSYTHAAQSSKDHDSGFEPSPRAMKSKIPTPRNVNTAHVPRRHIFATLDGRSCSSRLEGRRPGDRGGCDMSAVTRSIQRNIRRYYMERKIFQHLLELKSLQIRSTKMNEAVLVKRAVDDYHKSCAVLGGETGSRLRRYPFSDYTFKNFELFLYETLKTLQKPGTYNFQNINEVYEEAERRLSPDYNAYEKALQCTTKTHRCLHAAHAYTGIPCAAYIPMMNHHTMPKFGFGNYKKTGVGSFYLPKILSNGSGCAGRGSGSGGANACGGSKVALELSHGKSKQLISLPSDKLDSNKRYYVTFTVKESGSAGSGGGGGGEGGDGGGFVGSGCVMGAGVGAGSGCGAVTVDQATTTLTDK